MTVTESESKITLPSKTLSAGTYTFKVSNKGKFAHNLTVDGAGVQDKATPTLAPGSTGDLTVTLQKGSYEFYCSVDSHKDMGMDLTVQGDMTQRPVTHWRVKDDQQLQENPYRMPGVPQGADT